ncbi:trypsin-like serine protease [Micromonospora pattaloongensis]|uniref:trypsin-like serine protease n=1 Tax=Micromonospora pattaloongensis TaxID=405436 RepID=UPI0015873A44|nr:trypsin-like serine protease [Micromonospora pattaloongensis]
MAALVAVPIALMPVSGASAGGDGAPSNDPQSVDNIDPKILATMRQQEALQPAVQAIQAEYVRSQASGFTSIAFEGNGLTLRWKGTLTPGMQAAVDTARKTGPLKIQQANYSLAELEAAADTITARIKSRGGSQIQAIVTNADGSGLVAEQMPASAASKLSSDRSRAGKAPLASANEILTGLPLSVPVKVTTAADAIKPMTSRLEDVPNWNGGGYYETWRGKDFRMACTTGYGVSNGSGRKFVLTAAHCGSIPDEAFQGTSRYRMGPVHSDQWQYDLMLIDAPGSDRIFDGTPTTSNYKIVRSWGYHASGELLCQSGATSGTVCGLRTEGPTRVQVPYPGDSDGDYGYIVDGLIRTTQVDKKTAAQAGDSGGPVFSLDGSGVRAKGISSSGGGSVLNFQDWADVIRLFGCYPLVG